MREHWHFSIENVLFAGISAIVVIRLTQIGAAWLGQKQGVLGTTGHVIGSLVTLG